MKHVEILIVEYNNLWAEKLIHKEGIRKFHNYLTYVTTLGSIALAFHGINTGDFLSIPVDADAKKTFIESTASVVQLFFVPFAPVVLITLTFPINDMFHIYALGNQMSSLERRINHEMSRDLLSWEHATCPVIYGGKKTKSGKKIVNLISFGDYVLLVPVLFSIGLITTVLGALYLQAQLGFWAFNIYLFIVIYMIIVICYMALKLQHYVNGGILITDQDRGINAADQIDKKIAEQEISDSKSISSPDNAETEQSNEAVT